ncbi:hypothetical protein C8R46DRAFT_817978, partial [Mycena filopes]
AVRTGYKTDIFFKKILDNPGDFELFKVRDNLIYGRNRGREEVLCIPNAKLGEKSVRELITEQAHQTLGHYAGQRT